MFVILEHLPYAESGHSSLDAVNVLKLFFFLKIVVFRAGIHKMLVRITNREDPDQTASSEVV